MALHSPPSSPSKQELENNGILYTALPISHFADISQSNRISFWIFSSVLLQLFLFNESISGQWMANELSIDRVESSCHEYAIHRRACVGHGSLSLLKLNWAANTLLITPTRRWRQHRTRLKWRREFRFILFYIFSPFRWHVKSRRTTHTENYERRIFHALVFFAVRTRRRAHFVYFVCVAKIISGSSATRSGGRRYDARCSCTNSFEYRSINTCFHHIVMARRNFHRPPKQMCASLLHITFDRIA